MVVLPILLNAKVVVETGLGVGMGETGGSSTGIWLRSMDRLSSPETRTLYTFEIENNAESNTIVEKVRGLGLRPKWNVIFTDSRNPNPPLPPDLSIDLLYLDAGHDYRSVSAELAVFSPFLTDSSLVLTDDSLNDHEQSPTDTYQALRDWADARGWATLFFTKSVGMTLCYKTGFC